MTGLPFAVFDEFGKGADDRVQDYATRAYAEGRTDENEQCADPLPAATVLRIRNECRALGLDDVAFAWRIQKAASSGFTTWRVVPVRKGVV